MPRLVSLARKVGETRFPMEVEISLDLLPFLPQQEWEEISRPESASEPRAHLGIERRLRAPNLVAVLGEQLPPHLHVPLFHAGQLDVDVFLVGIGLLTCQREIQIRGVGFVLPMMEPLLHIGLGHVASYYPAMS